MKPNMIYKGYLNALSSREDIATIGDYTNNKNYVGRLK